MHKFVRMRNLLVVPAALFCLAACTIGGEESDYAAGLLGEGTPAPDFVIRSTADSTSFTLGSLRGGYVLVEFWASWCPDCREATPVVKRIHGEYSPKGLVMVGVSFDSDETEWRRYVADNGLDWIQHREQKSWKESEVAAEYNIRWIPTLYLIAPDGTVDFATTDVEAMADTLAVRM